jgi:hypothetical protein
LKKKILGLTCLFMTSIAIFYISPIGWKIRVTLAESVVVSRYQDYAWILVGKNKRDQMIQHNLKCCTYRNRIDIQQRDIKSKGVCLRSKHGLKSLLQIACT